MNEETLLKILEAHNNAIFMRPRVDGTLNLLQFSAIDIMKGKGVYDIAFLVVLVTEGEVKHCYINRWERVESMSYDMFRKLKISETLSLYGPNFFHHEGVYLIRKA